MSSNLTLQYFLRPKDPVEPKEVKYIVTPSNPFLFNPQELEILNPYRSKYAVLPGTAGVATLAHTNRLNMTYTYSRTEYGIFRAFEDLEAKVPEFYSDAPEVLRHLAPSNRELMRVSSVGVLLMCPDGYLAQVRSPNLRSSPMKIDPTASGIANIFGDAGGHLRLDLVSSAYDKIKDELVVSEDDIPLDPKKIESLRQITIHSSSVNRSGMIGFLATVSMYRDQISFNPKRVHGLIPFYDLFDFVVEHLEKGDITGDCVAVFLGGLSTYSIFLDAVSYINDSRLARIEFGRLENGLFVSENWPQYTGI